MIVTICTVQLWKSDDDDDTSTSGPKYGNVRGSYNEGTVTSSMALARPFRVWTGSNKRDISGSGHGIFRVRIFTVPCLTRFFPFFLSPTYFRRRPTFVLCAFLSHFVSRHVIFSPIHRSSPLWWKSATNIPQSMSFAGEQDK